MENIEPVEKTEYKLVIEPDTYKGQSITRLELKIDNGHQFLGIAGGYGGLSEYFPSIEEAERHFRLFAAAPDLLAALEKAVEDEEFSINLGWSANPWYADAKAAIAKAKNIPQ